MRKAVVLLSGGLDSAVTLFIARKEYECSALVFDYGQKASCEVDLACRLSSECGCDFHKLVISMPWQGSSLLDKDMDIPHHGKSADTGIPDTYVPARNIIFLSYGVSFAEAIGAEAVFIGAHQLDFSNYPDCRSEFFERFREMIKCGTRSGHDGKSVRICTPVIDKTKKEIVETGYDLGVPFEHTWSCYRGGRVPCGECESCMFRIKAFEEAGLKDPLMTKAGQ